MKQWSKGQNHGYHSAELEQQILRLVKEIRLEHIGPDSLTKILDDPWLDALLVGIEVDKSSGVCVLSCTFTIATVVVMEIPPGVVD